MISAHFLSSLRWKVGSKSMEVLDHLYSTLRDSNTGNTLDGSILYTELFGSLEPIIYSSTINFATLEPIKPREYPSADALRIPIQHDLQLVIPCSKKVQLLIPICSNEGNNKIRISGHRKNVDHPEPEMFRQGITRAFGVETLESIDRTASIYRRLDHLATNLFEYAEKGVKSEGALYKLLPSLFTIHPVRVPLIRITREATPPPQDLVDDLNLLASLLTSMGGA